MILMNKYKQNRLLKMNINTNNILSKELKM